LESKKPEAPTEPGEDPHNRLKKIQYQLEQRAKQEAELLGSGPVSAQIKK
jgi:hypothetical protein